jgi:hypothetical protein
MHSLSIRLRVVAIIVGCFVLVALAGAAVVNRVLEGNVQVAMGESLARSVQSFESLQRGDVERLSAAIDVLVARPDLLRPFEARDRAALLAAAGPVFEELKKRDGIGYWYFFEPGPPPRVFLRVHRPALFGDSPKRVTLARAAAGQGAVAGMELGMSGFALRVLRPVRSGGMVIGYLELGEGIGEFLGRMRAVTGDDYGLLVKKSFLDQKSWTAYSGRAADTWNDRPDVVLVDATSYGGGIIDFQGRIDDIPERGMRLEATSDQDRNYVRGIYPVEDAAGQRIGALFVRHDVTGLQKALEASRLETIFAVLSLSTLVSLLLYFVLDHLVFARLGRMMRSAEDLSARLPPGRFGARGEVITATGDELTRLEDFFRRFSAAAGEGRDEPPP